MEEIKKRYAYWDNIKGILILLVIFGHLLMCVENTFPNKAIMCAIYLFHMPAFIFISGFFSKSEHSRSFEAILKLGVAFFLLNTVFMLWRTATFDEIPSLTAPYYSAWYLLALIIWRITVPYFAKVKYIMFYLIILALSSVCWQDLNIQYAMVKVITFYPFFMAGYLFSEKKALSVINMPKTKKYLYCFLSGVLALASGIYFSNKFQISMPDLLPQLGEAISLRDVYARASFFVISAFTIMFLMFLSIEKRIPLITKWGKNTLIIFILHRPITLGYTYIVNHFGLMGIDTTLYAILGTFLICFITGSNVINNVFNRILDISCSALKGYNTKFKQIFSGIVIASVLIAVFNFPFFVSNKNSNHFETLNEVSEQKFDNAFKIAFTGDLILLEDQVKKAKNTNGYSFDFKFQYAKKYIESADLAIGVLEGPFGQGIRPYSQGNFLDGRFEYVNFPDKYADAIKKAGFDLLTTANNHLLDAGIEGARRTIDVLNKKKIDYIGSYKNEQEHQNRVKLIEKDGIKMALLAYTYGVNEYSDKEMMEGKLSYITNVLPDSQDKLYLKALKGVKEDFKKAKSYNPDLIIVIPHWGTQFSEKEDEYQKIWEQNFINLGADIILGAHSHHVQKVRIKKKNDKKVFSLYSPGNFVNQFIKFNGDSSVIAEVYIDKKSKKVIGGSVVPLFSHSALNGNFISIPVYDAFNNEEIKSKFSVADFERIKEVHKLILRYMLNVESEKLQPKERYYFDENGIVRE